jgi:hypothetical protein
LAALAGPPLRISAGDADLFEPAADLVGDPARTAVADWVRFDGAAAFLAGAPVFDPLFRVAFPPFAVLELTALVVFAISCNSSIGCSRTTTAIGGIGYVEDEQLGLILVKGPSFVRRWSYN